MGIMIKGLKGGVKYKKATARLSRDGRDNRQDASLHYIIKQQGFYKKNCAGMHLIYIIPTILVCVLFDPTFPT